MPKKAEDSGLPGLGFAAVERWHPHAATSQYSAIRVGALGMVTARSGAGTGEESTCSGSGAACGFSSTHLSSQHSARADSQRAKRLPLVSLSTRVRNSTHWTLACSCSFCDTNFRRDHGNPAQFPPSSNAQPNGQIAAGITLNSQGIQCTLWVWLGAKPLGVRVVVSDCF